MPIEILELIVRARVQQNGPCTASTATDTQSGGGNSGATESTQHTAQGAQQPTVEEVVSQLPKRRSER